MARVDLHNFFQYYDERNPNHVKAVQWLEDNLPVKYLEDTSDWAEIFNRIKLILTISECQRVKMMHMNIFFSTLTIN